VVQNGLKKGGWGVKTGENGWMGLEMVIGVVGGGNRQVGVNVGGWWLKTATSSLYVVRNIPLTRRGAIVVVVFVFVVDP